jgi:hypothetical protein
MIKRRIKHGHCRNIYPNKQSPELSCWSAMIARCSRPSATMYHRYGARGISVCERWSKFENFLADMGERPSSKHTLDRINPDGNYEPSNCRWATRREQALNRGTTRRLEYCGEELTVSEWANRLGINKETIRYRIKRGWSIQQIITIPANTGNRVSARDQQKLEEMA